MRQPQLALTIQLTPLTATYCGGRPHRAGSTLLTSHIPHGAEPQTQRLGCVLKNRPRSDRGLVPAAATNQPPTSGGPSCARLAARSNKTVRPTKPDKVIPTSLVRGESALKLQQGLGVVFAHIAYRGGSYLLWSVESIEYLLSGYCHSSSDSRCFAHHQRDQDFKGI